MTARFGALVPRLLVERFDNEWMMKMSDPVGRLSSATKKLACRSVSRCRAKQAGGLRGHGSIVALDRLGVRFAGGFRGLPADETGQKQAQFEKQTERNGHHQL